MKFYLTLISILCLLLVMVGCGSDTPTNPLGPFQPEVINNADAFQFQITDANNVVAAVSYEWANTGTQATINHSTAMTDGSATVVILDADSTRVYSSGLLSSANESSLAGTAGT